MKKFVKDVLFNATYQVLLIILPIITLPILSRRLGADGLGVYAFIFSIAQFLMIVIAVGMNPFRIRRIAQNKGNIKVLSKEFWNLFYMQFFIGTISIIIYTLTVFVMNDKNQMLYYIQILFLIGVTLDIAWFFQGIEEFSKVVTRNIIIKILTVIFIIIFVRSKNDLGLYVFINSISMILGSSIFWISIFKHVCFTGLDRKLFRSFWKPGLAILIPQIFMQVYTSLDKTVVGYLTTADELSYYDQSQKIARILLALISSVTIVMLPKMTSAITSGDKTKVFRYVKKVFDYTTFFSLLMFVVLFVNTQEFIIWFFGSQFAPMTTNMLLMCFIIILSPIGGVFANQLAIAMEKDKEYAIPLIAGACISLVGNFILVPKFESLGATIVLLLVEFIVCFFRIYLLRDILDLKNLFDKDFFIEIAITIIVLIVGMILPTFHANHFINMTIKSIIVISNFLLLMWLTKSNIMNDAKKIFAELSKFGKIK